MSAKIYRAEYRRNGKIIRTRFYASREQAQNHLQSHIGWFQPLGAVAGDTFEYGVCDNAPRNGGLVSIETREAKG